MLAYTIAQRTREMGLRMALGADPSQVRRMVFGQMARMTLVGGGAGLVAALILGAAARSMLFGLDGFAPFVVAASAGVLAVGDGGGPGAGDAGGEDRPDARASVGLAPWEPSPPRDPAPRITSHLAPLH